MDEVALRSSPVGQLVPISGHDGRFGEDYDHWAFVPDPLPTLVDLSPATWRLVGDAMLSLGRLDQAGRQVPNPALLRRPTLRREAQSTSALEGTYAPLSEVLEADPDDLHPTPRSPELREVLNYVRAAEHPTPSFANAKSLSACWANFTGFSLRGLPPTDRWRVRSGHTKLSSAPRGAG